MHPEPTPHTHLTQPPATPEAAEESHTCDCIKPIPRERAARRGAAQTYCARCGRDLPLWLGVRWAS